MDYFKQIFIKWKREIDILQKRMIKLFYKLLIENYLFINGILKS